MQLIGCTKEETPIPSEHVGVEELFSPALDAHPLEKSMFKEYGVWARMEFKDSKEVYNSYLGEDVNSSRYPVEKVDAGMRESAYIYLNTLLSNVNKKFSNELMPNEVFFVKTYGNPYYPPKFTTIGRNRLVITWPNAVSELPIVDPEMLYYADESLTWGVWDKLTELISQRLLDEIDGFEELGKPYDGGVAFTKIRDQYFIDYDIEKRNRDWQTLADEGGYLDHYSSFSFKAEYKGWLQLILTESSENINAWYLDGNPMRKAKYELFVTYFKEKYNWDIQAAGNKFRETADSFQ
ncbi:hypothetical protein [Sphingobacterium paucimobilis]|uniref:Uncharacterized protein n=1 Tax=Sphingobacterium paucimobilis HER1398 TaxID=1346330 RepID=U2HYF4_9SPHI|nr:hypothetical protein [Sphingobacterium paucimobilis]ERJ57849.1 hypothetical protein M472_03625 [Sphingobacterium paucimobilis HER1398]ERJ60300.1 hypothetical protein M472_16195 [Sphingobacterium paucimobilis HER1398]